MPASNRPEINFFRPVGQRMQREVGIAAVILGLWALLSFGVPLLVWAAGLGDAEGLGRSFLTEARFLGFPLHYWLLAQGCTIGYVLLCWLFCRWYDQKASQRCGRTGEP